MGLCQGKEHDIDQRTGIVGSTVLSGRSIVVLGDSALIPLRDKESNE